VKWFRFHADALNNPKVQRLYPEVFRAWVNILCIACEHNGAVPEVSDLAFLLRLDEAATQAAVDALVSARLLEKRDDGYTPHDWDEHQYRKASDDPQRVKERVTRYRALRNALVTRPEADAEAETDSETDSETEQKKPRAHARPSPNGNGISIPSDLSPGEEERAQMQALSIPKNWYATKWWSLVEHYESKPSAHRPNDDEWRRTCRRLISEDWAKALASKQR
jgi:hypothetical protein